MSARTLPIRPHTLRRRLALAGLGAVLAGATLGVTAAPDANADIPSSCTQQFWLMLGANTRTICDGPIQADGSWLRAREFWTPAHYVRGSGYCSRYSCSYTEGYFQPTTSNGIETYIVTPSTVLADEPGHLA